MKKKHTAISSGGTREENAQMKYKSGEEAKIGDLVLIRQGPSKIAKNDVLVEIKQWKSVAIVAGFVGEQQHPLMQGDLYTIPLATCQVGKEEIWFQTSASPVGVWRPLKAEDCTKIK